MICDSLMQQLLDREKMFVKTYTPRISASALQRPSDLGAMLIKRV